MKCECGYTLEKYFVEGEILEDEIECPICGEIYTNIEWQYKEI